MSGNVKLASAVVVWCVGASAAGAQPVVVCPFPGAFAFSTHEGAGDSTALQHAIAGPVIAPDGTVVCFGVRPPIAGRFGAFVIADRDGSRLGPMGFSNPEPGSGHAIERIDGFVRLLPDGGLVFYETGAHLAPARSVWRYSPASGTRFVTAVGKQVPGLPDGTVFESVQPAAMPNGSVFVFGTFRNSAGVSVGGYFEFPQDGRAARTVALVGDLIPGSTPMQIQRLGGTQFGRVSVNSSGKAVITGFVRPGGAGLSSAAAIGAPESGLQWITADGLAPPNPSLLATVAPDGRVFVTNFGSFARVYAPDGTSQVAYQGLPVLGLADGEAVVGPMSEVALTSDLRVVLLARVGGPGVTPDSDTVLLIQRDGVLRVLIREGQAIVDRVGVAVPNLTGGDSQHFAVNSFNQVAFVGGGMAIGTDLAGQPHVLLGRGDPLVVLGNSWPCSFVWPLGTGHRAGAQLSGPFAGTGSPLNDSGMFTVLAQTSSSDVVVRLQIPGSAVGACCNGAACSLTLQGDCLTRTTKFAGPGVACNAPGSVTVPCCRANFDQRNGVGVFDLLGYVQAWFAGESRADIDGDGPALSDLLGYLDAWFAGC